MKALWPIGLAVLVLTACSAPYYSAMEKLGIPKREILVDRVQETTKAQEDAKQQFASALDRFMAVTHANGGDLQREYERLQDEYDRSAGRAKAVRERISAVEDVADALFREWKGELAQYSSATLRRDSEREYDRTHERYDQLIRTMKRAADRMDPVLAAFHDQVLFLKHNLNAQALASLSGTQRDIEADVTQLIADMNAAIREAEAFVASMNAGQPKPTP